MKKHFFCKILAQGHVGGGSPCGDEQQQDYNGRHDCNGTSQDYNSTVEAKRRAVAFVCAWQAMSGLRFFLDTVSNAFVVRYTIRYRIQCVLCILYKLCTYIHMVY